MTSSKKKNSNFMIQGTILAVSSIIVRLIGMVYRIPLNHIIGDEGMGLYGSAFEVYNIALLLSSYSLPQAVSKLVAARNAKKERNNAFRLFKAALIFGAGIGLLVGLVIFLFAKPIATYVMATTMSWYALRVLGPCIFVVALLGVLRGYFQGQGTMIPTAFSQIIEQIINAIVSVVAAFYLYRAGVAAAKASADEHADLLGAAYGASGGTLGTVTGAVAALVFLVLCFMLYRRVIMRQIRRDKTAFEESYFDLFRILLLTILPIVLSSAIYNICGILDQAIFNHMMAGQGVAYKTYTKWIGMYTGKYLLLINIPLAMANAMASSTMPTLSAAVAMEERKSVIREKIDMIIRFAMLIAIPCFIGFIALGSPILQLLWGDTRAMMAKILALGAISVVFYSLSTVTNAMLQACNHMKDPLKNACISLIVHVILLFILLGAGLKIYAVVIANALFSLCMCILNQIDLRKATGYRQNWKQNFLLPLLSAVIMGVLARLIYFLLRFLAGNTISALLSILIAVCVYAGALLLTGTLTEEELYQMPKGSLLVRLAHKLHLIR